VSEGSALQGLVLCLCGPTATGKTDRALALAGRFPLDLVSVDSAMVYRGLDIGSGKPSSTLRTRVPHALVDVCDPREPFSAGMFVTAATAAIAASHAAGRVPLLVGGTHLYFRALVQGLADLPDADPVLRAGIEAEASRRGWPALHAELARVDPVTATRITRHDRQRIQRALEVFRLTGQPLSAQQQRVPPAPGLSFLQLALEPADRGRLHAAIEARFNAMMRAGFLAEVAALRELPGMSLACPSMRSVGYRQLWQHLDGDFGLEEACRQAVVATRRLAKRQLTWLRGEAAHLRLDSQAPDLDHQLAALVERALQRGAKSGVSR
jgi:tRNA dimethylallyltransferase